jgi:hypothetical protein
VLGVQQLDPVGRDQSGQVGQHRGMSGTDLDLPPSPQPAHSAGSKQRLLRVDPQHRVGELVRQQLDHQPARQLVGVRLALGEPERTADEVGDPTADQAAVVDRADGLGEVGAKPVDSAGEGRRVEGDVDAVQDPQPPAQPCRHLVERCGRRRHDVLPAGGVLVDDLGQLAQVSGDRGDQNGQSLGGQSSSRRVDGRQAKVRRPVSRARHDRLHGHPPLVDQIEGSLERQHIQHHQGADLAEAVPGHDDPGRRGQVGRQRPLGLQLGELGRRMGDQRHLGDLGAVEHPARMAHDRSVGPA